MPIKVFYASSLISSFLSFIWSKTQTQKPDTQRNNQNYAPQNNINSPQNRLLLLIIIILSHPTSAMQGKDKQEHGGDGCKGKGGKVVVWGKGSIYRLMSKDLTGVL